MLGGDTGVNVGTVMLIGVGFRRHSARLLLHRAGSPRLLLPLGDRALRLLNLLLWSLVYECDCEDGRAEVGTLRIAVARPTHLTRRASKNPRPFVRERSLVRDSVASSYG